MYRLVRCRLLKRRLGTCSINQQCFPPQTNMAFGTKKDNFVTFSFINVVLFTD